MGRAIYILRLICMPYLYVLQVATMNSAVMSGYGKAMGRANIDAVSIKELPMALVHTREVTALCWHLHAPLKS